MSDSSATTSAAPSPPFAAGCRSAPNSSTPHGSRPRLGPRATRVAVVTRAANRALRARDENDGYFSGHDRRLRRRSLSVPRSTTTRSCIPIRRRGSSRRGRTGRRRSSIPPRFAGPTAAGRACRVDGQVIYEMHVGTFTREGTWAAAANELPELARLGITRHRGDAGRRVRRPLRLGLRRRRSVRADAPLRHARTTSAASSMRRTRSASA